jgi:hypothetical protein
MKKFFIGAIILAFSLNQTYSQPAAVILPSLAGALPVSQVAIPVTVSNFDSVCHFSLVFTFDTNVLSYESYHFDFHPGSDIDVNRDKDQIRIGYYCLWSPIDLPDEDTLILLNFSYLGGTTGLNWDFSPGSCMIGNCDVGIKPCSFINGNIIPLPAGQITGTLVYDNNLQAPLPLVQIVLKDSNGLAIDTCLTSDQGFYYFQVYHTGSYSLSLSPPQPWNGVNSMDALRIIRHFVGTEPLTGLALKAADVNNNYYVNTSDALIVLKRFVAMQSSFLAGD